MRQIHELSEYEISQIIEEYHDGASIRYEAEIHDVHNSSLRNLLINKHVELRKPIRYSFNSYFFDTIDTEEKAYWVGFIAADAHIEKNGRVLTIELALRDKEHLNKFLKSIDSNHIVRVTDTEDKQSARVSLSSEHMILSLAKLGITNNKTERLTLPDIRNNLIKHFWRGMIDGDGTLCFHNSRIYRYPSISLVGTEKIVDEFIKFCKTITDTKVTSSFAYGSCNSYCCSIKGYKALDVAKELYCNSSIFLTRKKSIYEEFIIWSNSPFHW